jgi:uncharacterized membrane protein YjjP (DUF1212 family)
MSATNVQRVLMLWRRMPASLPLDHPFGRSIRAGRLTSWLRSAAGWAFPPNVHFRCHDGTTRTRRTEEKDPFEDLHRVRRGANHPGTGGDVADRRAVRSSDGEVAAGRVATAAGALMADPCHDPAAVASFVAELGAAMNVAGEPVYLVQERIGRVAAAYGAAAATVTAFPTYLMITMGPGEPSAIAVTTPARESLRLDQVAALEELVGRAERAEIEPAAGLEALADLRATEPRLGRLRGVAGYAVLAAGICLVLHPAALEVLTAAALGAVVGVLRVLVRGQQTLTLMTPVIAAFCVSALCALMVEREWSVIGMRPMVAALVVFLPGATLTTAVLELAAGQMISGSSRLVAGGVQLALLAFGILAGIEAVGVPRSRILFGTDELLGEWSRWLGVLVFAVGVVVAEAAPPRSLPGLLAVLYAAWTTQVVATEIFGGYVAALLAAAVMTVAASVLERFPRSLPGHAAFLPGFWLLVPGALGLIGLARFAGGAGPQELLVTVGSIFAVALGVLCGTQVLAWAVATGTVIDRAATSMAERAPMLRRFRATDVPPSARGQAHHDR